MWLQTLLQWVPPILFAYIVPAVVCALLGVNYQNVVLHQWSKAIIIPLAIITIMASMSLNALRIVGLKPLVLFVTGSFVIALLPVVLLVVLKQFFPTTAALFIDDGFWKGLIPLVGSWIGGSTSQLVLKEYVAVREDLFLSVLLLDNMIQNIVMIFLFQIIRRTEVFDKKLKIRETITFSETTIQSSETKKNPYASVLIAVCVTAGVLSMEFDFIVNVIILSLLGLLVGNLVRFWSFTVNLGIGTVGIIVIMSILGLKLKFNDFELPFILIVFMIHWMIINALVIAYFNYKLKISMAWGPIAMMANIGGISTSPALASVYNKKLMPHAVVLAILSMATGTFWGFLTTLLIELLI